MERVFSRPVTTAGELIEGNPAGTVIGGQWQRPEPVLAEKLTLESKELTLSVGQTGSVEATLTPEPTLEKHAQVKWESYDPTFATVDPETGLITAVSEGIVVGVTETTLEPGSTTRAQTAVVLMRLAK